MKNKMLFLLFFYLATANHATGQEKSYAVTFGIETGLLSGTSREIVYNGTHSRQYISELQWNMKPLWFIGVMTGYGPRDPLKKIAFFTELEIKVGIPAKTGSIEDRDWLTPVTTSGALTHFSSHDNKTIRLLRMLLLS
jgi:outer membrane protease